MNMHEKNLFFLPLEQAEELCGILYAELTNVIAESKRINASPDYTRLEKIQALYIKAVDHRRKLQKLNNINQS